MAGKEFPLSLVLKAVDRATAPLRQIGARLNRLSISAAKVGAAMSAAVSAPLAALGVAGARAFATFESGMTDVSTLIDTNTESLAAMSDMVLAIGRRTPVAYQDLTSALYDVRSAGVSAANQFKVLEGAARLAVAGKGTTKQAVDLVTSSLNAFNLQGEEAARVYDVIFKAVKFGKTDIAQLAQGFGGVASTVASAGIKLDEYVASVASLTTGGLPAAQAHTQLKAVISGLTRQTAESKRLFDHLGAKSFKDLIAKSGGMVPAVQRISTALHRNEADILNLVGSTEALGAILGLTGNQAATFGAALKSMREGANEVDPAYEKQNAAAQKVLQRLSNQFESFKVVVGRTLVPIFERFMPVLERLSIAWEGLSPGVQEAIVLVGGFAAALGPVLAMVGLLIPVFAGLTVSMLPVIALVALFAGLAYLVIRNWDEIKLFFKLLWEDITAAFESALKWIQKSASSWSPLGLIIANWEPISEFFSGLWEGIVETFSWAWDKISPITDALAAVWKRASPIGAAMEWGRIAFGAEDARPTLGAEQAAPPAGARSTEAHVVVDFNNAPAGTRATQDPASTAPLEMSMGYSMVTP